MLKCFLSVSSVAGIENNVFFCGAKRTLMCKEGCLQARRLVIIIKQVITVCHLVDVLPDFKL